MADNTRTQVSNESRVYEPPTLYVVGPVTQFTFGSSGALGDGAVGKRPSDVRLKQSIQRIDNALDKLRMI